MTGNKIYPKPKPKQICALLGGTEAYFLKSRFYERLHSGFIIILSYISSYTLTFSRSFLFHLSLIPLLSFAALRHFSSLPHISQVVTSFLCHSEYKIFILSYPCPLPKTLAFRSFSNFKPNCTNNSLRQSKPYMVLSVQQ